jgi:four helix bundle protein
MFGFEKLDVWQESLEVGDTVYELTREFPDYERFGLARQMRRAAVSISSSIAEGSSRASKKDSARFVELAYGSVLELVSQLHIAQRQESVDTATARSLYLQAEKIARMLSGLQSHLRQSSKP